MLQRISTGSATCSHSQIDTQLPNKDSWPGRWHPLPGDCVSPRITGRFITVAVHLPHTDLLLHAEAVGDKYF